MKTPRSMGRFSAKICGTKICGAKVPHRTIFKNTISPKYENCYNKKISDN